MSSWFTREMLDGREIRALNVVLPTVGCYYNRCHMCSYASGVEPEENLSGLLRATVEGQTFDKLKIFCSGSFFDTREISEEERDSILSLVASLPIAELTVESRPELIGDVEAICERLGGVRLEVAIGLESANDRVLAHSVNKGFSYKDFLMACEMLDGLARKKAYLLIKPPFLTEGEAIEDAVSSAHTISGIVDVISLNPVSVHRNTLTEYLWRKREYRPPWLWSVARVLNECQGLAPQIICHPVALGKERGAHNCPKCDEAFRKKIEEYNFTRTQIEHDCACRDEWKRELEAF